MAVKEPHAGASDAAQSRILVAEADQPCIDCLGDVVSPRSPRLPVRRPVASWLLAYLFAVLMLGTTDSAVRHLSRSMALLLRDHLGHLRLVCGRSSRDPSFGRAFAGPGGATAGPGLSLGLQRHEHDCAHPGTEPGLAVRCTDRFRFFRRAHDRHGDGRIDRDLCGLLSSTGPNGGYGSQHGRTGSRSTNRRTLCGIRSSTDRARLRGICDFRVSGFRRLVAASSSPPGWRHSWLSLSLVCSAHSHPAFSEGSSTRTAMPSVVRWFSPSLRPQP